MGKKLTKKERNWILYDVGNSAFTLLIATILPIYFNYLAGNAGISSVDYLAYWGYAASVGTILVALEGPVLGTMADTKGFKKPIFTGAIITGVIGCALLGLAKGWMLFLVIYIIAKVGFSSSLIFYDSMLGDVTDEDRMDYVSGVLRFHAAGYHDAGTSGRGFLSWVCMGVYRKLCAVYCLSGACAWQRKNRNQHGNGNGSRFFNHCRLVACDVASTVKRL